MTNCEIVQVGKRRDGAYRYWCVAHHANATAKYGVAAEACVAAGDQPISETQTLSLDPKLYPGGVALWGSVPAVYDTTTRPTDRGIHVHARSEAGGEKQIDLTYRKLRIPVAVDLLSLGWSEVDEIDAINYMVSGVFGFETISVTCGHCGYPHLDRDWFAVHAHRRHQCHGCGRQFSDSAHGVGNPLSGLRSLMERKPRKSVDAPRVAEIKQADYPGGLQVWGSNPAIVWTSDGPEEMGIHLHGFKTETEAMPELDDTFAQVVVDGFNLDAIQVRHFMAQSAMPHLEGRIVALSCRACGQPHFDTGELAFTPHVEHDCMSCGASFSAPSQMKKTIGNPFAAVRVALAAGACNPLRNDKLGLRPETI